MLTVQLGVSSIQEKVREMQRMEENNKVRAVGDMREPGKRPRGRPRGRWMDCVRRDRAALWITPEDTLIPRTEHYGNQEFRPLIPPSGKWGRRRNLEIKHY